MCFSVEVNQELKKLQRQFNASVADADLLFYELLKKKSQDLDFVKSTLKLKRRPTSAFFKEPLSDNRVFPGYFTWVMVQENGRRVFKKMRYRLRPQGSAEEIPSKFNVFNARLDSLTVRPTWKPLFSRQHGIFPFTRFYEWVEDGEKKRLIAFSPEHKEIMWAPCLWDYWTNPEGTFGFYSFALITDDPPPEVMERGHDRCPIFLKAESFEPWLNPHGLKQRDLFSLLKQKEEVFYLNAWAA